MTAVITVPPSLDDSTFDQVLAQLAPIPADQKLLVDARHTRWASPFGLTALLALAQSRGEQRPAFTAPEADETLSYWARTGFFRHAEQLFDLVDSPPRSRGGESSVLLEITPIGQSGDVHEVVERIQAKAQSILQGELNLDPRSVGTFSMVLSEACQNIVEHAGATGWVGVQTYRWRQRLGRKVLVIAVCDTGIGFRRSLELAHTARPTDRWDDAMALEDAVIRGVSRFRLKDSGRGHGLAGIRRYVGKWDGKLSVRSGTARIAIVPSWDDGPPLEEKLPPFVGAQMQITIPEKVGTAR